MTSHELAKKLLEMPEYVPTEQEVRQLRDAVFGKSTDKGWENCKENWCKPKEVQWLIQYITPYPHNNHQKTLAQEML